MSNAANLDGYIRTGVRSEQRYAKEGGYVEGPPDLAVEIQSTAQSPADVEKKIRQYFAAGTHTVWLIDPRRRYACLYGPSGVVTDVDKDGFLEPPEILPGVRIALQSIFEAQLE